MGGTADLEFRDYIDCLVASSFLLHFHLYSQLVSHLRLPHSSLHTAVQWMPLPSTNSPTPSSKSLHSPMASKPTGRRSPSSKTSSIGTQMAYPARPHKRGGPRAPASSPSLLCPPKTSQGPLFPGARCHPLPPQLKPIVLLVPLLGHHLPDATLLLRGLRLPLHPLGLTRLLSCHLAFALVSAAAAQRLMTRPFLRRTLVRSFPPVTPRMSHIQHRHRTATGPCRRTQNARTSGVCARRCVGRDRRTVIPARRCIAL